MEEDTMATNSRQGEREASDQGMPHTSEQAKQTARAMGEITERTMRTGVESLQRNTETAKRTWQSGAEVAGGIAQRSMEQLSNIFGLSGETLRDTLQQSSGNVQAVMESTTIIASSLQDVTGEWMRFAERRGEQNLDYLSQLRECRNLHDYLALQTQIVRDNMEAFLQSAERTSERTMQIARTAVERMSSPPEAPAR